MNAFLAAAPGSPFARLGTTDVLNISRSSRQTGERHPAGVARSESSEDARSIHEATFSAGIQHEAFFSAHSAIVWGLRPTSFSNVSVVPPAMPNLAIA